MNFNPIHHEGSDDLHVLDILNEMRRSGLPSAFICSLMETCQQYEGISDLMEMWLEEVDPKERSKIVVDLQESIDDIVNAPPKPDERPYLRYDDIDEICSDVIEFKRRLREEVD